MGFSWKALTNKSSSYRVTSDRLPVCGGCASLTRYDWPALPSVGRASFSQQQLKGFVMGVTMMEEPKTRAEMIARYRAVKTRIFSAEIAAKAAFDERKIERERIARQKELQREEEKRRLEQEAIQAAMDRRSSEIKLAMFGNDGEPIKNGGRIIYVVPIGPRITPYEIMSFVADRTSITTIDLKGPWRTEDVVHYRHIAMWMMRNLTLMSLPQIGVVFGNRDHTTILNAVNKIEAAIERHGLDRKKPFRVACVLIEAIKGKTFAPPRPMPPRVSRHVTA